MKKVLLTGVTGFIGRNVLEFLGSKYNFLAPAKEELDLRNENEVLSRFNFGYKRRQRPHCKFP